MYHFNQIVAGALAETKRLEYVILIVEPKLLGRLDNDLGAVVSLENFDFGGLV